MKPIWIQAILAYSIVITLVVVGLTIKVFTPDKEKIELNETIAVLQQNNETLEDKCESLEKEIDKLENKIQVLKENEDDKNLIASLESKIGDLEKALEKAEKNNKDLKNEIEKLKNTNKELNDTINYLKSDVYKDETVKKVVNIYNQQILDLVDMVNMNPSIFKYDEVTGLIDPQYVLNVLELNERDASEYHRIQMLLYEATGIHDPVEAVEYLLNLR